MKNKRFVLYGLSIMLVGVIYFTIQAQQKNATNKANFSGEWRSKESISMGGNIVCTYVEGDRMLSKKITIAEQADFLTIEAPNPSPGAVQATSVEKLTFDGKQSKINYGGGRVKEFTAKLSADRKTITINSIVHLMAATPYNVKVLKQLIINVTEVWKLSDDGKSITVLTNAKSTSSPFGKERSWKTVFDKA